MKKKYYRYPKNQEMEVGHFLKHATESITEDKKTWHGEGQKQVDLTRIASTMEAEDSHESSLILFPLLPPILFVCGFQSNDSGQTR